MPTDSDVTLVERSTGKVVASFTDENGDPVVPNSLVWSLVDSDRTTIINSRQNVTITPASSVTIKLSAADLQIIRNSYAQETRYVVIEGDYDSSLGTALPIKDEVEFQVYNLAKVPNSAP